MDLAGTPNKALQPTNHSLRESFAAERGRYVYLEEGMGNHPNFYNKFSLFYDWVSTKSYYAKPRESAINELHLRHNDKVLNIACGTGQNLEYLQNSLQGTGMIVGIDLSAGMLAKANEKIVRNGWDNVNLVEIDAEKLTHERLSASLNVNHRLEFDSAICELGLTAIPGWKTVINNMIRLVRPGGRIVVMDWYMEKLSFRGRFINWIGDGDITKPIPNYLNAELDNYRLDRTFKRGEVYVASGTTKINT